jgi:hypothetical protein
MSPEILIDVSVERTRRSFLVDAVPVATLLVAGLLDPALSSAQTKPAVVPVDAGSAAGTAGLDPLLAGAYTLAADEAHRQGVQLWITSGYRTWAEQDKMWRDAIVQYGSPAAARHWVLPPGESTHVTGHAIDVGPQPGAEWLQANGNRWGLCRLYANEWWHFELATTPGGVDPPMLPDASTR